MAQLKDSSVSDSIRVTDALSADDVQAKIIYAPTASGGTTYGVGTNGQVIKSNGTTVYWATDNNSMSGVKGNSESSYRTGNVNITPANIGALAIFQGTDYTGYFLVVNSSGNVVPTAI